MSRRSQRGRRSMADMNVVPYIDVMLVLLVIFMVTAPMMQTGVELNLPNAETSPLVNNSENAALIISVDASGQYFVDDSDGMNLEMLTERLDSELQDQINRPVYLRADREVAYGFLMQAMAVAQQVGAKNIGLMADPDAQQGK